MRQTGIFFIFLTCVLTLTQLGCGIKEVVVTQSTDSTPNALFIEQKIEAQLSRINQGSQTGDLEPAMALGLTENDELVRHLALKFRASNPSHDLNSDQTGFLGSLLRGNSGAIDDALNRRDVWVQAFDANGTYDYALREDRLLFISVLQANLKVQENAANSAAQAENLTPDQVQEAQQRVQSVRDVEISDFHQNGGLDLSSDQILELQQMAGDSSHFIRFLAQGAGGGTFAQQYSSPSGNYPTQAFANSYSYTPATGTNITNNSPNPAASTNYWNGRPTKPKVYAPQYTATPVPPAPTSTFTPVPPAPTETFTPVPPPPDTPTPAVEFPTPIAPASSFMAPPVRPERSFSSPPARQPAPASPPAPSAQAVQPAQPVQSAQPAQSVQPSTTYLAVDSLKVRDKQLDQLMDAAKKQSKGAPDQLAAASQMRKAFHQILKADLQANQKKGLTQEQMDQLSKMLDEFAKAVSGLETPDPGPDPSRGK